MAWHGFVVPHPYLLGEELHAHQFAGFAWVVVALLECNVPIVSCGKL